MTKKIIALLMAVLMVMPVLVSCGKVSTYLNDLGVDYEYGGHTQLYTSVNDEMISEINSYISDIAYSWDEECAGMTFTWCGNQGQAPTPCEETGNIKNDALYFRQREIEDRFGINWVNYITVHDGISPNYSVYDYVFQDVMAGIGAYDACYGTTIQVVQPLLIQNTLMDMSGFQMVDFEQPWWPDNIEETLSINGSMYFLNGSIVTTNYEDTYCIAFNKKLANNYGVEDLYSLANSGEWTYDKMFEVSEVIPQNSNRSGVYRFGDPNGLAAMYSCGMTLTSFDALGTPYLEDAPPEALCDLSEKLVTIFANDSITANIKTRIKADGESVSDKYGYSDFNEMFSRDNFLFYNLTTGDVADLRQYDVTFGVLPMPKGDKSQENYISATDPWGSVFVFVPRTARNVELTDLMIEVLAALGYKYLKPAYYDLILKSRSTYDYESMDMIDIIFETKIYDLVDFLVVGGNIYVEGDFVRFVRAGLQETTTSFVSNYRMQARIANRHIKELLKSLEEASGS